METKTCYKLVVRLGYNDTLSYLYGIIISQDDEGVSFRTAKNVYYVSREQIISLSPTNMPYRGEV